MNEYNIIKMKLSNLNDSIIKLGIKINNYKKEINKNIYNNINFINFIIIFKNITNIIDYIYNNVSNISF
tara:strand:- start:8835 stop:9041 length:207 start_codon:yes stop_codon:yes gene_type:complete